MKKTIFLNKTCHSSWKLILYTYSTFRSIPEEDTSLQPINFICYLLYLAPGGGRFMMFELACELFGTWF